jgi:hypothetical protein
MRATQDGQRLRLAYGETGEVTPLPTNRWPTIDKAGRTKNVDDHHGGEYTQGVQPGDTTTSHKATAPVMG